MATSPSQTDKITENVQYVDHSQIKRYGRNIFLWAIYDLANTIYSMGIVSLIILPLVTVVAIAQVAGINPADLIHNSSGIDVISESQFEEGTRKATAIYGLVLLIGNLLMAFLSPFLGAYADQLKKRKYFLAILTAFCLLFIYSISLELSLIWILTTFLLANLAYQMSLIVYDSMIPFIARPKDTSKVSGFGVAFGYFGSFIAIGIAMVMAGSKNNYLINEDTYQVKIGYIIDYIPIIAVAFLLLAIPILFTQEARTMEGGKPFKQLTTDALTSLKMTAREIFSVRDTKYFMIGWILFVDTANTIIAYMSILITLALGLSADLVTIVLGIGILSAVLFTFPVGAISDKIGPKKTFYLVATLWLVSLGFGLLTNLTLFGFSTPPWFVYIMALVVGPALGGTWVAQRQMITQLAPTDRTSNYFGFANIFGRISSALGPQLITITITVLTLLGVSVGLSWRMVIILVAILLLIGLYLISKVEDRHQDYLAGARHVGKGQWFYPVGGNKYMPTENEELS